MRLKDKVAIITGGANGMGAAQAALFAAEGASVVVADVTDEEGRTGAAAIVANGGKALYRHLDVSQESQWEEAIRFAVAQFGTLDILVNNAGISGAGAASDLMDTVAFERIMDVNAKGVFLGMKHAMPVMKKNGGGAIVNISSTSAFGGLEGAHMAYNASKAACHILTKSAAVQNARDGIRVNSVHPGMHPPMIATKARKPDPALREKFMEKIPMRRAGRVEELAHAVLFLASDEASYITGASLVVDGGWTAQQ
jgi:NAD(P)-dependent dehydrogenase (short-subunit alcohol dehydrogenase family)